MSMDAWQVRVRELRKHLHLAVEAISRLDDLLRRQPTQIDLLDRHHTILLPRIQRLVDRAITTHAKLGQQLITILQEIFLFIYGYMKVKRLLAGKASGVVRSVRCSTRRAVEERRGHQRTPFPVANTFPIDIRFYQVRSYSRMN